VFEFCGDQTRIEVVQHDADFVLDFCLELAVLKKWPGAASWWIMLFSVYPTFKPSGIGADIYIICEGVGDAPLLLYDRGFEDCTPTVHYTAYCSSIKLN
jgi:hypothetical protein